MPTSFAERAQQILLEHVEAPYPPLDNSFIPSIWDGNFAFILAALTANKQVLKANTLLGRINPKKLVIEIPSKKKTGIAYSAIDGFFAFPCLLSAYLNPVTRSHLTRRNENKIEELIWRFLKTRSKFSSTSKYWSILESENIDANLKLIYYLGAQALLYKDQNSFTSNTSLKLSDNYSLLAHYRGWESYWMEYFRQRALEGIHCEIASTVYSKYTLQTYYLIHDFTRSPILRRLAKNFITLFWADVAHDYIKPASIRGGAMTRIYKDNHLPYGRYDGIRDLYYLYGWTDVPPEGSTFFTTLIPALSSYKMPVIVKNIAAKKHLPLSYISRRFGLAPADGKYNIQFDNGDSYILRHTYITNDYVMGTLTFSPNHNYVLLVGQNRAMSVFVSDDIDSRLVVHGKGTGDEGLTGVNEIDGICSKNCMIVGRDSKAKKNVGTLIFISLGSLWNNLFFQNGWFFTKTKNAFFAIRIAYGGFQIEDFRAGDGKVISLEDWNSPIIIQMGQKSRYKNFFKFIELVKKKQVSYELVDSADEQYHKVTYASLDNDSLVYNEKQKSPHKINGDDIVLNPKKTYSSRYISGVHGKDLIQLMWKHSVVPNNMTLNFSYPNQPIS